MKKLCCLAVLMALGTSAHAGESISFVVGGHRIRIEAPRHCRSTSCVSVSTSGVYRRDRDRFDQDDRIFSQIAAPSAPPQPVPAAPAPPAPMPAPQTLRPTAAVTAEAAPPPPPIALPKIPVLAPSPEKPAETPGAAPSVGFKIVKASQPQDMPNDTPLGDWQTENKGSVRVEKCGQALCGYALNSADQKGEAVLVNMKPKPDAGWSGSIYSHDSGDTYYGTMTMSGPDTLRVEACAFGRFYCSGNTWRRIATIPTRMISLREPPPEPRS